MAVTTGTTTGSSNTGKTPDKPSGGGGPGGGSLQAPSRTTPSASPSGTRGAGSNTGPGSARPGTSSSSSSSSDSSKKSSAPSSSTTAAKNPTGGSLQAPSRTTPSTSSATSASTKKTTTANNPTGGSLQAPSRTAPSTNSVKVTDPSRGLASPMSGQGTSYSSPQAAKKANTDYAKEWGFANRVSRGLPATDIGDITDLRNRMGPFRGPGSMGTPGLDVDFAGRTFNPNSPETEQQYQKSIRDALDATDARLRGLKGIDGIDDDLRTPQEVRETVDRLKRQENAVYKQLEQRAWQGDLKGTYPRESLMDQVRTYGDISKALPDVAIGASRSATRGITSGANSLLSGPTTPSNLFGSTSPQRGLTAPAAPSQPSYDPLSSIRTRAPSPVSQDPAIAGRAAQANANYKTTSLPGGMVSRTYSDPDVPHETLGDTIMGGLRSAGSGIQSAADAVGDYFSGSPNQTASVPMDPSLAGRRAASSNLAQQLGFASGAAYDKIKAGLGSFIDNLMSQPLMGEQPVGLSPGGITPPNTGNYPSRGTVGPGYSLSEAERSIPGSVEAKTPPTPKEFYDRVPRDDGMPVGSPEMMSDRMGIVTGTDLSLPNNALPGMLGNNYYSKDLGKYGNLYDKARARAAAEAAATTGATTAPSAPAAPSAPTQDEKRQKVVQDIQQTRRQGMPAAPEMGVEDVLPPQPVAPQPAAITTWPNWGAIGGRQTMPNARAADTAPPAPADDVVTTADVPAPQPTTPSRKPTNIDINGGPEAPSQEGTYPPDENFTQADGQPQSYDELKNRGRYEVDQAIRGAKEAPGKILDAILGGDLRRYTGTENDKRSYADRSQIAQAQKVQKAIEKLPADQQAALVTLLMSLIQQQQQGLTQADLVNSTFI